MRQTATVCARVTVLYLLGGLVLGLGLALALNALPMHAPPGAKNVLSGLIFLAVMTAASVAWGREIGRRTGCPDVRRIGGATAVSFGPAVIVAGVALTILEGVVLERGTGPGVPVHVAFTLLFVPAAFFVAGITAFAIGVALGDIALALRLAAWTGLAVAAAFFVADILMDLAGWRVGAPGAAERATMLTVMMVGNLAAAVAGGAMLAIGLLRRKPWDDR